MLRQPLMDALVVVRKGGVFCLVRQSNELCAASDTYPERHIISLRGADAETCLGSVEELMVRRRASSPLPSAPHFEFLALPSRRVASKIFPFHTAIH